MLRVPVRSLNPRFLKQIPLSLSSYSSRFQSTAAAESQERPFDKVMIANRGEIVERVIRTCNELDIATVAIHSTADSKARFVQKADEAICIGPAASSESYMNVPKVLDIMKETGAQAIHPGYGFLSENADFCRQVSEQGVFLGPTPDAITKLGDKIESKNIAVAAGVAVVPGFDGVVESLDQALHICNEELGGYPVLLKAAAGGGGKGMRVCWNDQDLSESWGIAKSEGLKFFNDDRLLLEKFIVSPHHIEFQVVAAPTANGTDVVVFPERECSIQRRNQKVIEETPSCLLKEETRLAMVEQVRKLCQVVGYQSAGTVEFLVDEEQNFYFLEMNTRLQVEHPVTEAVCGNVDLVKAMLWVGAGWGLPDELKPYTESMMPHHGHAIEGRIYAEDPLRGFLPSTGPLTQYVEPSMEANTPEAYIRLDAGVEHGHVVSPHYDPMLSKLVYYGPDRKSAITGLSRALDEYVIEGVQHNARLVQSVLREPAFVKGETPTSFLPTHYPDGFNGVELNAAEKEEFAVAAAAIDSLRRDWLEQPPLTGMDGQDEDTVIVKIGGMFADATYQVDLDFEKNVARVVAVGGESVAEPREIKMDDLLDYDPSKYMAKVTLDGATRSIQVINEAVTGEYKMQMYGADCPMLIESKREYELSSHMHAPVKIDTSDFVLSPMPGSLISIAVSEGDKVMPGQEMCIVEAMKMQNIIRSPREGTIASIKVDVGASLKADQIIIALEKDEE